MVSLLSGKIVEKQSVSSFRRGYNDGCDHIVGQLLGGNSIFDKFDYVCCVSVLYRQRDFCYIADCYFEVLGNIASYSIKRLT